MATTTDFTQAQAPATQASVPRSRKARKDGGWGNPAVYFAALVLIALMIGPVLSSFSAGSGQTRRSRPAPPACPIRGSSPITSMS